MYETPRVLHEIDHHTAMKPSYAEKSTVHLAIPPTREFAIAIGKPLSAEIIDAINDNPPSHPGH